MPKAVTALLEQSMGDDTHFLLDDGNAEEAGKGAGGNESLVISKLLPRSRAIGLPKPFRSRLFLTTIQADE